MIFNLWEVSIRSVFFKNDVSYDVKIKRVFETHCKPYTDLFILLKRCSSHVMVLLFRKIDFSYFDCLESVTACLEYFLSNLNRQELSLQCVKNTLYIMTS